MPPLAFLKCLGKAAVKQAANMAGFGLDLDATVIKRLSDASRWAR